VSGISRRSSLKAGAACLGAASVPAAAWCQRSEDDALQRWIKQNAVRINASPGDPESGRVARDAERLIAAIGGARIVMLGEPSHGAGSAFAAKVRVVRLLHERLGFDVLAWESGLIDLERTESGLCGDVDPVEAAQRGILKIWSASAECRPLFAYTKASHSGARPLTMAGFDMQLTAPGTLDYFAAELHAFLRTLDPVTRSGAEALAEKVLNHFGRLNRYTEARPTKSGELGRAGVTGAAQGAAIRAWDQSEGDALRPAAEDFDRLEEAAGALERLLRESGDGAAFTPTARTGFMIRAITGLAGYGANLLEAYGKHSAEEAARYALTSENRRDQINASLPKYKVETVADPAQPFDALYFIDTMKPATSI
jgi:erythromycin esterase-like protein